ncbi:MAG: hypothetical protein K0S04_2459 [Herbinix sp.]|jgi:DNA-directed RNA polymerase subunit RPC12/RpoP|nr:hypothetical protein [Herbinix sp.]
MKDQKKLLKKNRRKSSRQIKVGGALSILFGFMDLGFLINYDPMIRGTLICFLIIFCLSLYTLISGIRSKILGGKFETYIELLNERETHSIDQLALMLNEPAPLVRKNLEKLIKKKLIAFAYIDDETNTISRRTSEPQRYVEHDATILKNAQHMVDEHQLFEENLTSVSKEPRKEKEQKVLICESCGAKNTIVVGDVTSCQYCGNGLIV